jgi:predicted TIM-barrel fold metal-dependent hydrolase
VRDHPRRFGFFAALPWPNVDASLKEIEYAFDVLKVDGVGLITSYAGRYPGEAEFKPIWQELNRRKAVVYFHPSTPGCCGATVKGLVPAALEFPYDGTRAIASLLTGLVFTENPDIRFIFSHGGGALPTLADRLSILASVRPDLAKRYRGGALAELKRLYVDTASVTNPSAWNGMTTLLPQEQILFGTDYPFGSVGQTAAQLNVVERRPGVVDRISHGNAKTLFPRFAA